ncbi:hypothetical protein [Lactobacillus sp.]|uniref:hypothetical protein n=1 Tax=Lactobacillus sp. TaxID=1591 RepID=UPI0019CAADFF|nr:hypothetical protein [Lactobacillus sp.]MBD5429597.1 hypothetical protein [Lactobacillus sp.]
MHKNKLIKVVTTLSAGVLLSVGFGMTSTLHPVQAASSQQTTNDSTLATNVVVKNAKPTLYGFTSGKDAKAVSFTSNYTAGQTIKVLFKLDLNYNKDGQDTKLPAYYVENETKDGVSYMKFILASDVEGTPNVPDYAQYKINLEAKQKEEAAEFQKTHKVKYMSLQKNSKKTIYYYTGYRKSAKSKKVYFKATKSKVKANTIKVDYTVKSGKTTYGHRYGKSNQWVKMSQYKITKVTYTTK